MRYEYLKIPDFTKKCMGGRQIVHLSYISLEIWVPVSLFHFTQSTPTFKFCKGWCDLLKTWLFWWLIQCKRNSLQALLTWNLAMKPMLSTRWIPAQQIALSLHDVIIKIWLFNARDHGRLEGKNNANSLKIALKTV